MLSKDAALDLALAIWSGPRTAEIPRLDRIDRAMKAATSDSFVPTVAIPADAPALMKDLARKSQTNYLPLLVRTFRQALKVDGYLTSAPAEQNPWRIWQSNRMDARQGGIHQSALKYGAAYMRVMPGVAADGSGSALVKCYTPRYMTAVYQDVESDEFPAYSLHVDGDHVVLTDDEAEYRFGVEDNRTLAMRLTLPALTAQFGSSSFVFIEATPHDVGVCPAVRFRDEMLLDGEEQFGIIEPLIAIQERIDETSFGQLVAQYFAAFRQRYVIGWLPESEAEEIKAGAARIAYIDEDPKSVQLGEWAETDLTRYIEAGKSARRDFAAIGQIPAGDLGVDAISNVSDATLAGLERSKNQRAAEIATALGESYEQAMRLMAHVAGDAAAAGDFSAEIRWREREARTWAGTIDGLTKLVASQIVTASAAVDMIPGLTDQQVEAIRTEARRERARQTIAGLTPPPPVDVSQMPMSDAGAAG